MGHEENVDALVVGAGPTGLTAALELAAAGVSCRIIDKQAARSDKSRALVVQARTLELLERHGLGRELVARGATSVHALGYVAGRKRFEVELGDIGVDDTPFPFVTFVSQVETERVLEHALLARGSRVERPIELRSFADLGDRVRAELSTGETVQARWIVGADGAHSAVREGAGLAFEGARYPQDFILADVSLECAQPHGTIRFFLGKEGLLVALPLREERMHRLIASRRDVGADAGDPTLDEFQALWDDFSPEPARLFDPRWLTRFRLHHRGVDRYRRGRAFVAGDAAHIHSPAGGQGMNTGIQDAINLAWKLALVRQGRAGEALLESYHAERHPVGRTLLRTTDRLFRFAASRDPFLLGLRNLAAPLVVPFAFATRARRARAFRFISQLGIHYAESPIVAEVGRWSGGPAAGHRAPPLDVLRGVRHHLLAFGGPPPALARWSDSVLAHALPPETSFYDAPDGKALYLIRPDGYVAFRCPTLDPAALESFLAQVYAEGRRGG